MRVAFRSSLEDLTEAVNETLARNRVTTKDLIKLYFYAAILVALSVACISGYWAYEALGWFLLGVSFYMILSVFLAQSRQQEAVRRSIIKKYKDLDWDPYTVDLLDMGIVAQTSRSIITLRWPTIITIDESTAHLRFIGEHDAITQIPLRVFRSEEDKQRFIDEANRLWEAHRSDTPPTFPEHSGLVEQEGEIV